MEKNKKKKWPLVVVMVAIICISLGAGVAIGKGGKVPNSLKEIVSGNEQLSNTTGNKRPEVELKPIPENKDDGYSTTRIFEKVDPSVVSINVYTGTSVSPASSGTGIVMSEDGYIITNAHVVDGGTSVNVVFNDGTQMRGTIVGSDAETDIAVVKVSANGLTAAEFGDSDDLKIGERAIAIGNAGGLASTCTEGIISGLKRDLNSSARSLRLIQTSAAINPGNSGGPLVNRYGQVIGITSAKIASVDYEGIGFAIPITDALPIIQSLIENGYVTGRAVLGVQVIELNDSNGPINGLPNHGVYIASITVGSDLANKGVRERDVIVEANGVKINKSNDLLTELEKFKPGEKMDLVIYRPETDQTYSVEVVLMEAQ